MTDNIYEEYEALAQLEDEPEAPETEAAESQPQEDAPSQPVEIVGVRFKVGGKVYYFDPQGITVEPGQDVIIETSRGQEYGQCAQGNHMVDPSRVVLPLRPLIRIATDHDAQVLEDNKRKEKRAFDVCQQKILEHGLDMKLVDVEYSFDGSKILFFFTSDGRVDFRELVKNLASIFRTRIELRQIGVRDEAKMLGGLGICGRPFCCSSFLDDFHPVSIKMAKTQNLSLNPTKISGCCGRLMCCLKYEQDAYEDLQKRTPKLESYVDTPLGKGVITDVSLLKASVKVTLDDQPDETHTYKIHEITVLHNGNRNKKSAPLLPPDPPVVFDEPDTSDPDYPEIIYSDIRYEEEKARQPESTEEPKRRSRNRNRNRKKGDKPQQQPQDKQEKTQDKAQDKPKEGQKSSKPKKQKPKTEAAQAPKAEEPKEPKEVAAKKPQRRRNKPKAENKENKQPQDKPQQAQPKAQQPKKQQENPQQAQSGEGKSEGSTGNKPRRRNNYYRNRKKTNSGGENKPKAE